MEVSRRTALRVTGSVVVASVAGCVGLNGRLTSKTRSGTPRNEATTTRTEETADQSEATTEKTPTVERETVAFERLSADARKVFERALEADELELPADRIPEVFSKEVFVEYEGETYILQRSYTGRKRADYSIQPTAVQAEAADEAETTPYQELSPEAKEAFVKALERTDSYELDGYPFPDDTRYVEYEGRVYALGISTTDVPVWRLWVEETGESTTTTESSQG